jgi:hypothetical protein
MKQHAVDILMIVGGMFLYGIRNMIGKWLVTSMLNILNKILKDVEHYVAIWLHKQAHKRHRIPDDCIKGICADI